MKKLFAPYNIAKSLKEKGFNEKCFAWYIKGDNLDDDLLSRIYMDEPDSCEAPLFQQVTDWFRDKHKLVISIVQCLSKTHPKFGEYLYIITLNGELVQELSIYDKDYYHVLNDSIKKALKLI